MTKKYLISRTDNIGDVVLTLPLAGLLKQKEPNCEVWLLARDYVKDVAEASPYLDGFIRSDNIQKEDLQKHQFDVFINADAKSKTAKLAKQANIPCRIGTSHRLHHWLYCNKLVNFNRKKSQLHEAQLNTKLLKPLGFKDQYTIEELTPLISIHPTKNPATSKWLNKQRFNLVIHPGSNGNTKEWPLSHWIALIKALPENHFHIILTGTETEKNRFKKLEEVDQDNITNLMGKCRLSELISLIQQVNGIVVGSTGPLHIAAALGTQTLGLFPPYQTANPLRWGPVGKNADYLVYQNGCKKQCRKPTHCFCMQAISVSQVKSKILTWRQAEFLAEQPNPHSLTQA